MMKLREGLDPSFQAGDAVFYKGQLVGIVTRADLRDIHVQYIKQSHSYVESGEHLTPGIWSFTGPIPATWRT